MKATMMMTRVESISRVRIRVEPWHTPVDASEPIKAQRLQPIIKTHAVRARVTKNTFEPSPWPNHRGAKP